MLCVAVSRSGWLLLRHARFCAWPPLVLFAPSLRVPTVSSITYAYLALQERFSFQDCSSSSTLGISLSKGRLFGNGLWCSRGFSTYFFCVSFLSFYLFPVPPSSVFSVPMDPRCVSGLVVESLSSMCPEFASWLLDES